MKIEELLLNLDDISDVLENNGTQSGQSLSSRLDRLKGVLEQHHKDLMWLVETWRHISSMRDSPLPDQACYIMVECADQLESLINPKD